MSTSNNGRYRAVGGTGSTWSAPTSDHNDQTTDERPAPMKGGAEAGPAQRRDRLCEQSRPKQGERQPSVVHWVIPRTRKILGVTQYVPKVGDFSGG